MSSELKGKRIAILATDGFEQSELLKPQEALKAAGATVEIISIKPGRIQGMEHHEKGKSVIVDRTVDQVKSQEFAALMLPGGVANPDALRTNGKVVRFVREFFDTNKPVAAICHAPWTLIEADVVRDRKMTSWPSLKTDLTNAGAHWVDEEVVTDRGLVTSRKPDDLPAFMQAILQAVREGKPVLAGGAR